MNNSHQPRWDPETLVKSVAAGHRQELQDRTHRICSDMSACVTNQRSQLPKNPQRKCKNKPKEDIHGEDTEYDMLPYTELHPKKESAIFSSTISISIIYFYSGL